MKTRRATVMIMLLLVLMAGVLPLAMDTRAQMQDPAMDLAAICPAREEPMAIGDRPPLLAAVPTGVAVTALAHHPAVQLPEGTEFVLSLDRLTLVAGQETKTRRTVGPTLFLVEDGTIAVIDSGHPRHVAGRPGFGSGESVLVERNRLVRLHNTGDDAGSVLLLGLLPPEGQLPIGPGAPASWIPFPEDGEQHFHRRMLLGEIGALAREETLLFAACLHWTDLASEITPTRYPGPVGVLVLRGEALVNDTKRIGPGNCWLSPSYTSLRIRAGGQAPDIVLFGALITAAQPQIAVGDSDASASLECAGPTATDDT